MTAATEEKLQDVEVIVAQHHRLRVTRTVHPDGEEYIIGTVPADHDFGDWRIEDDTCTSMNPSIAEINRDVSAKLGFAVRVGDDGIDWPDDMPNGTIRIGFDRVEESAAEKASREYQQSSAMRLPDAANSPEIPDSSAVVELDRLRGQVAELTRRLDQAELRDKGYQRSGLRYAKAVSAENSAKKAYQAAKAHREEIGASIMDELAREEPLFDHMERAAAAKAPSANGVHATPPAVPVADDSWKAEPLDCLEKHGATKALLKILEDADLKTMGDLVRFQEAKGLEGHTAPLTTLKGLKGKKLEILERATTAYWASKGQTVQSAAQVVKRVAEGTELPAEPVIEKDLEKVLEQESDADAESAEKVNEVDPDSLFKCAGSGCDTHIVIDAIHKDRLCIACREKEDAKPAKKARKKKGA